MRPSRSRGHALGLARERTIAPPLDHFEETFRLVDAGAPAVFAYIDLPQQLSMHMERPSWRMAGATMRIETDAAGGQALGSRYRLAARAFGIRLEALCEVTERDPPRRKAWCTVGEPTLLVVGQYRMSVDITAERQLCRVRIRIDYALPARAPARWIAKAVGPVYARWCVRQMADDLASHFGAVR